MCKPNPIAREKTTDSMFFWDEKKNNQLVFIRICFVLWERFYKKFFPQEESDLIHQVAVQMYIKQRQIIYTEMFGGGI